MNKVINKHINLFGITALTLMMVACTTSKNTLPTIQQPQTLPNIQTPPSPPPQNTQTSRHWFQQPPADFIAWAGLGSNPQRIAQYEAYLRQHNIDKIVPTYQLLRTARSWESCGYAYPYALPSSDLWDNAVPTLQVLKYLAGSGILTDFEVTSVYRDPSLNRCAGGARNSKHVHNNAIDFRLGPINPNTNDLLLIEQQKRRLCQFWEQYGENLNLGLGVYASGQIHIDTEGYRTWGPDLSRNTSICRTDHLPPVQQPIQTQHIPASLTVTKSVTPTVPANQQTIPTPNTSQPRIIHQPMSMTPKTTVD